MAKYERGTARSVASMNDELEKIQNSLADKFDRKPSSGEPNQLETDVDMNGNRIYNLPDPQSTRDAVHKDYVDSIALEGLPVNIGTDKVFESVANAKADVTLTIGDTVRTLGYTLVNDGGGAQYVVVTGGSGVEDGGSYINTSNGLQLKLNSEVVYGEMFGVSESNTAEENTLALNRAFAFQNGKTVKLRAKRYKYSGTYNGVVNLVGEKRPILNEDRTALSNGTILEGVTNFSGDFVYVVNIGVDHGEDAFPTAQADAFKASASPYNSGRLCVLHGVVGLGRNDLDPYHAILVEGYQTAWVQECIGAKNQFAIAIKSRSIEVDGCVSYDSLNGIIIKSDTGGSAGSAANINLSNFTHFGSDNSAYSVRILSDNAQLQRLNINNVNASNTDRAITLESATALNEVNISNINAENVRKFGVVTSGSIFNINMHNINMADLGDYAGQLLSGAHIVMSNCYFSLKNTSTHIDTALRVEGGVSSFSGTDIDIVVNRDNGVKGSINFANARTQNYLTKVRALIRGNIPEPGVSSENVDDGIINPLYNGDTMRSVVKLSASAPVTITQIVTTMPDTTTNFPTGYRLILMSIGQTLTYQNGANMRMKTSGDKTRTVNQLIEFVWMGSSWHQADDL